MRRAALGLLLAGCTALPTVVPQATPATTASASATVARVATVTFDGVKAREHLTYLADPARGGRFSGSAGFADAARYVAKQFEQIGLEPLGDAGTYFQRFSMKLVDLADTPTLSRTGVNAKTWTHRVDFTESIGGRAGSGAAEGTLAVVGGAATEDFAGVDARGRIALVTGPTTQGFVDNIVARGAAGLLLVGDPTVKYSYIAQFAGQTLPVLVISETVANDLLAPSGKTVTDVRSAVRAHRGDARAPESGFAIETTVRMSVPLTPVHEIEAMNVVGLLRAGGADGARAVLVGAHLDGVGTDPNGTVFPAANDNASGPSIAIEVARSLAARRSDLKRSVVFVAFAGEEEGFLGSEAYIARMSASPGRVESLVAMINLDVIGCCGNILEASNESKSLQDRVGDVARRNDIAFRGISGGGSDQQSFARRGVPSVLILWSDYVLHTTRDALDMVDLRHLQRAGDVVAQVAYELARGEGP